MGQKKVITKEINDIITPIENIDSFNNSSKIKEKAKSSKKQVINGIANVNVSYNNTIISISDSKGNVLAWSSAGILGFKGTKKSTPYVASLVAKNVIEKIKNFNLMNLKIVIKGIGPGRESAIRSLAMSGLNITSLVDKTPIAHNGVKSPKPRRV
jgi:small subunit ribosomal protein S11